ncbi:MAG TPA: accessory colonization factor [Roseobacter sp.]|uniref:Accessory colonization factor AcfC n=2 Tax=root TaxID=1 RepID=A0ABY0SSZ7_9RHOB|nr:substrate-binding domain-containing protein [Sulfitobacter litoralis]SDP57612.1 accessory colonization factor AcfC [Sulfitobacter litoralis]HDZ82724.1 accessory colonization factor [Roseobacter sp.]
MKLISYVALNMAMVTPAFAQDTVMFDPDIVHEAKDGVVRLYGAGGPHTALQKVADLWQEQTGGAVAITFGPEPKWSQQAQADADIIWGTSEQSMTAFLETYKSFSSDQVMPIYLRPAIIAVKAGNPKSITGFDDLLAEGIKVVVTEGAGVGNTSGTGVWEDVAGRTGSLSDVVGLRKNIVAFEHGSGAGFKAFTDLDADAWITWPDWTSRNPEKIEAVAFSPDRAIWRDLNVALAPDADPEAQAFLNFLVTDEAQSLMKTEGWTR